MGQKLIKKPNTIAIFRALQLGDMLCAIPAVRAVKTAYPKAKIFLIGLPWAEGFAKRFSRYFNGFLAFPGWPDLPEQTYNAKRAAFFLRTAQKIKFDLALQMHGSGSVSNSIIQLLGAKRTAGFYPRSSDRPNQNFLPYWEHGHEINRLLRLSEFLGIPSQGTHLEFPITKAERGRSLALQKKLGLLEKPFVCMHPGGRDARRRWDPTGFARLADAIAANGHTVALTGTEEERLIAASVAKQAKAKIVVAAGLFGLGELGAMLERTALLVTNDTGVSHMASALKTPSVIIFSPYSDPKRWAPLNSRLHAAVNSHRAKNFLLVKSEVLNQLGKK